MFKNSNVQVFKHASVYYVNVHVFKRPEKWVSSTFEQVGRLKSKSPDYIENSHEVTV